tara:strand:- start:2800 stop:3921 length:1122 start_codon:yes stop_codon:yes gene_type:complete
MAFLDNSGDIILDAVLTESGRKKLSRGESLDIQTFALGDDEINYASYNGSDSRGSAYYDLEVLQTPILESITGKPAGINHGLLKLENKRNLLYLPTLKMVTKELRPLGSGITDPIFGNFKPGTAPGGGQVIYMCCTTATVDEFELRASGEEFWQPAVAVGGPNLNKAFLFLSGLDTTELDPTRTMYENFILDKGLENKSFNVEVDGRLFNKIATPDRLTYFLDPSDGDFLFEASLGDLPVGAGAAAFSKSERFNYRNTNVLALPNVAAGTTYRVNIFEKDPGVTTGRSYSDISPIRGPVSEVLCFVPEPNISVLGTTSVNRLWTDLGKFTNATDAGLGGSFTGNYYWIDTRVYITGIRTGVSTSFTIRLIRKA